MSTDLIVRREFRDQLPILVPDSAGDVLVLRETKIPEVARATLVIPRNVKYHRKFFALLNTVFHYMTERKREELGVFSSEGLLIRFKIDLGLYTLWIAGKGAHVAEGTPVYIPDSISFAKMDNLAFEKFFKSVVTLAIARYVDGQTEESLEAIVNEVLRYDD